MSPELHRRVRELFDRALEQPEAGRFRFLEAECGDEAEIFRAVLRLLDAHRGAQSFLAERARPPLRIGRYEVTGELGRGSMGIVYDAIDPMIGRKIALKVIHLEALADVSKQQTPVEWLFREARSAGALQHPGIVTVFDVGQEGGTAFFAMEKVDGPSLEQKLGADGKPALDQALDIVSQIAQALDYAHQRGVVHRDIKPANILLANGTTVKVADFSIAKTVAMESLTATGMVWGTPSYMSPEQIGGRALDGRSDQFALAVLAYELLTGTKPFHADSLIALTHIILYGPRPSARAVNPALPASVDRVFYRGLATVPEERFTNCAEFAGALSTAAGVVSVMPVRTVRVGSNWSGRRIGLVGAGSAVATTVLALGLYQFREKEPKQIKAQTPPAALQTPVSRVETVPVRRAPGNSGKPSPQAEESAVQTPPPLDTVARARQLYEEAAATGDNDLLRRAAEMGNLQAMVALGEMHMDDADAKEALEWFLKAADAGDAGGMLHLGGMFQLGTGVQQNDQTAAFWYQRAADAGNADAMFDLAGMYEQGTGVSKDLAKAAELYRQAAERGNQHAQDALTRLKVN